MAVRRFFLDESGHSGDLVKARGALAFGDQPIFALACVGIGDEALLLEQFQRLRRDHRVVAPELKAGALGRKLPAFGADLARFLIVQDWPIFIEIVDKRFFIAIHIVNHLLCGGADLDQIDMASRNLMAAYISDHSTFDPLGAYVDACNDPTIERVQAAIGALWNWIDMEDHETARVVQLMTMHARDRARSAGAEPLRFLPIADTGRNGRPVWMLPGLQSLTNIYARINRCLGDRIVGAQLVHDEQLQFGQVLDDAKRLMEQLSDGGFPPTPFADYRLRGIASLSFASSTAEPCIQAADILAGFSMRFVRGALQGHIGFDPSARLAFFDLLEAFDPSRATGVNLVLTERQLARAGIPFV